MSFSSPLTIVFSARAQYLVHRDFIKYLLIVWMTIDVSRELNQEWSLFVLLFHRKFLLIFSVCQISSQMAKGKSAQRCKPPISMSIKYWRTIEGHIQTECTNRIQKVLLSFKHLLHVNIFNVLSKEVGHFVISPCFCTI